MLFRATAKFAYGGVNARTTKLREKRLQALASSSKIQSSGGWFKNTFLPVSKHNDNQAHREFVDSVSLDIRKRIITEIKHTDSPAELAESYVSIANLAESYVPVPNEFVKSRISDILNYRANFNKLYGSNRGAEAQKLLKSVDMPELRDVISDLLQLSSGSEITKKEQALPVKSDLLEADEEEYTESVIISGPNYINTSLSDFWNSLGCSKYTNYNGYALPGRFSSSIYAEYSRVVKEMCFYDLGCEIVYKFTGLDKHQIINQFISCKVPENEGEVAYGCLINNCGHILDTGYAFYSKLENVVYFVTTGYNRNIQNNFIAEYVIYCQKSGLDIFLNVEDYHVIALSGKETRRFFDDTPFRDFVHKPISDLSNNRLLVDGLSNGQAVRMSYTGTDGMHLICREEDAERLARNLSKIAKPVGLTAVNIRRMESGSFMPSLDIISNQTPFTSALSWTVDIPKIRNKTIFGHTTFSKQIADLKKKRVALLGYTHLKPGSVLLSEATRSPIGLISSCAWSYFFKCRLAYGYVFSEFALHGKVVIAKTRVMVPKDTPKSKLNAILRSKSNNAYSRFLIIRSPPVNTGMLSANHNRNVNGIQEIISKLEMLKDSVTPRYRRPKPTF